MGPFWEEARGRWGGLKRSACGEESGALRGGAGGRVWMALVGGKAWEQAASRHRQVGKLLHDIGREVV